MLISTKRPRQAYSLIELLVVLAIIALLAALTASGLFRLLGSSKVTRSEETLRKIGSGFDGQWRAGIDVAKKEAIPDAVNQLSDSNVARARTLHLLFRLQNEFPQTFTEARNSTTVAYTVGPTTLSTHTYQAKSSYVNYLSGSTGGTPTEEAAVCLFMVLRETRGGAMFNPDAVGAAAVGKRVVGGKEFSIFVDAWGNPIGYNRSSNVNSVLNELSIAPYVTGSNLNSLDPEGILRSTTWAAGKRSQCSTLIGYDLSLNLNRAPVIFSPGKNKTYFDDDDLYHFRLMGTGKAN